MEIYNDNLTEKQKKENKKPKKGFTPDGKERTYRFLHPSERNFGVPFWEKLVFFLRGFIGLSILSTLVSAILRATPYFNVETSELTPKGNALLMFFSYGLLLAAFLLFLFFDGRKTYCKLFKDFGNFKTYIYGLAGFFALILINIFFNSIYNVLIPDYGANANQTSIETRRKASPFFSIVTVVLFAPFCEEMTYRAGLLDRVGKRKRIVGVIVSALVFGLIHFDFSSGLLRIVSAGNQEAFEAYRMSFVNELLNLPVYVFSGAILGLTYVSSGKLGSSMVSHLRLNALSSIEVMALSSQVALLPLALF